MADEKKSKKMLRVDKKGDSSLSAFVERPVPTEKEVASFERVVNREMRNQEIDTNLSEIYANKKGGFVDVKTMKIRRRQLFIIRFFRRLLVLTLIVGLAYFSYSYFFGGSNDSSSLELKISAPEKILAGEEFSYKIEYHNPSKFSLTKVHLEVQYPENFIVTSSSVTPQSGNYGWSLPDMDPGSTANLSVTGRLINKPESVNVVSGRLSYVPVNYSSQFKKEASASTIVTGPGFQVDLEYSNTAFLNQDNTMNLVFSDVKNNYLGDFNLSFALPEETNAQVVTPSDQTASSLDLIAKKIVITKTGGTGWQIAGLSQDFSRQEIPLSYKISTKQDSSEISVRLEKKLEDGQSYVFWEKTFKPELVKSDLNLTMFINGAKSDNAINFWQALNYTVSYSNKGDNTYKEVVIMAVLSGDFLDYNSLNMVKKGEVRGNTIIWTKNEIPELAEIKPGQDGEINFSINLLPYKDGDLGKNLSVVSYSQYGVNNQTVKGEDNKSNTITSKINSDLSISEEIRYFNEDNQPVGSGPLPPKVGEKTGFKVYWVVKNNLHELSDTRVVFDLPSNINWDDKNTTNVGNISYDASSRQVIWEIGRLPVSVYRADAEFGISVTPIENDRNKILVLTTGSTVTATDTDTKNQIIKKTSPKTTKLEDDDIAGMSNSGRVQ
ncbi:MAG: hypothetical protein WCN88_01755 [Candidatus Falkowbacteria bacterium]